MEACPWHRSLRALDWTGHFYQSRWPQLMNAEQITSTKGVAWYAATSLCVWSPSSSSGSSEANASPPLLGKHISFLTFINKWCYKVENTQEAGSRPAGSSAWRTYGALTFADLGQGSSKWNILVSPKEIWSGSSSCKMSRAAALLLLLRTQNPLPLPLSPRWLPTSVLLTLAD